LRVQPEMGGILHLRLNTGGKPIADKYREGKMKRTLKRESKELEVVESEAIVTSSGRGAQIAGAEATSAPKRAKVARGACAERGRGDSRLLTARAVPVPHLGANNFTLPAGISYPSVRESPLATEQQPARRKAPPGSCSLSPTGQ